MEMANDRSKKGKRLTWLFLLIGFFATGIASWQEKIQVDEERSSQFDLRVDEARHNIERQVHAYTEVLWGLRAQFVARHYSRAAEPQQLATMIPDGRGIDQLCESAQLET